MMGGVLGTLPEGSSIVLRALPAAASVSSAELAEDMEDERDLMPFEVLDACFALYAGEKPCKKETIVDGDSPQLGVFACQTP